MLIYFQTQYVQTVKALGKLCRCPDLSEASKSHVYEWLVLINFTKNHIFIFNMLSRYIIDCKTRKFDTVLAKQRTKVSFVIDNINRKWVRLEFCMTFTL